TDGEAGEVSGETPDGEAAEDKDAEGGDASEGDDAEAGEAPEAAEGDSSEGGEAPEASEAAAAGVAGGGAAAAGLVKPEAIPARTFTMAYDDESGQYVFYDVAQLLRGETVPAVTATEETLALAAQLLENHRLIESGRNRELPAAGKFVIVVVSVAIVALLVVIFDKRRRAW
ncbi:MAG: hypothetical protein LBD49_03660, partial [Oscillospiraceae bacterium]|nr:hypothetical protein [Oscillospiraceae bacterium]